MKMSKRIMILAVVLSAALAMVASPSQAADFVKGVLQPLPDGFPNRPLVIMVVDDPGTADSVYAMGLSEAAKKMSPVPILIEHRGDFGDYGNWAALGWIKEQGKIGTDGYISIVGTQPGNQMDLFLVNMKKEVGVGEEDYNSVAFTEFAPYALIQRTGAPWGDTMKDLIAYAKKNPNTVRFISGGISSASAIAMFWYAQELGFTVKEVVGGGPDARALAVAAGEGDITTAQPGTAIAHYQAGKIKVLMMGGAEPAPPMWSSAPNAESLGMKGDPFGTYRGLVTIKEVPESHRNWLETLFTAAGKDKDFADKRKQIPGLVVKSYSKADMVRFAKNAKAFAIPILKKGGIKVIE